MTTQRAPIIANYFKIGRKIPMTIPFIGHMLISGLLMLNVYAKDWPVEATISEVNIRRYDQQCLTASVLTNEKFTIQFRLISQF